MIRIMSTIRLILGRDGDLGPKDLKEVIVAIGRFCRMAVRGMRG
jgi:hypothetical protein